MSFGINRQNSLDCRAANLPRQIDLIGNSSPEILAENAHVPAEDSLAIAGGFTGENACGQTGWNCLVHTDGTVMALRWPDNAPELVIPLESIHSNSMVVLANTQTNLQLQLELRSKFLFSQGILTKLVPDKHRCTSVTIRCGNLGTFHPSQRVDLPQPLMYQVVPETPHRA